MSTFVPLFKRRWFKNTLILSVVTAIGLGGAYATFYHLSSFERLQRLSADVMQGSTRKITFDAQMERQLFPRPTVVLKNVMLSETDGRTPAMNIKQVSVGVAWTSVFGDWAIDKLVLNDLATVIARDDNGSWNFADLFKQQNQKVKFNRININNGQVMLQAFGKRVELNQIHYNQIRQSDGKSPYIFTANAMNPFWNELQLNVQGHVAQTPEGIISPDMILQFTGHETGGAFSGSLVSKVGLKNNQFTSDDNKLIIRTDRLTGHADINISHIGSENDHLLLNNINSVFTGSLNDYRLNGTLTSRQAKLDPAQLASDEITVNLTAKTATSDNLNVNLNAPATWHVENGLNMPKLQITTRQDRPNGLSRFLSEWMGSLQIKNLKNWHAQAQGQFDRQPVVMDIIREHNTINGILQMAKLDLANYVDNIEARVDNPYPSWITGALVSHMGIDIGTLSLPALEVNNIKTTLHATSSEARFEPFSADLYGGHTEGLLIVNNNQPVQYVMKQKAEGVQVRPMLQDLFRSGHISGKGDVNLSFTTTGATRQELTENLSGSLNMNVKDGNWYGINIRELMKAAAANSEDNTSLNLNANNDNGTPFSTFDFTSKINQGISKHTTDSHFTSPAVHMTAKGETILYSGRMSEDINILSNNGKDTLPLRITGTMDNPAISLNYKKITSGLKTAEQKKDAVTDAIKKQWDWMREQSKKQ